MKNPFSGQQGIALIIGLAAAALSFALNLTNTAVDATSRVGGILIFAAFVALFFPKYRPWGKGFLLGSIGTLIIVGVVAFLLSVALIALQ